MIKIDNNGKGIYTVYLSGDLDELSAASVKAELDGLLALQPARIIFDLAGLVFMNSTGVGVFLSKYKKAMECGTLFYVKNLTSQVEKLFRISGLFKILQPV